MTIVSLGGWPSDRVRAPAAGFTLVDRTQRPDTAHPVRRRSGEDIARCLEQCSLYDQALDLAIENAEGRTAGYALFWFDADTKVGLVEPVQVEDGYQRRGLARAMLCAGIDRLTARGAERVKVSSETHAAGARCIKAPGSGRRPRRPDIARITGRGVTRRSEERMFDRGTPALEELGHPFPVYTRPTLC
ncbi:N-acetyltransferase [Occultella aeris]|uniref:N-acetyltransferase domain-containing protein n=1 Tax=Occultella aeris TaxID=2761496 RepID=A0A7M4DT20_9MICO|nr:GNAT family N-acetyltransferase [Occultella aeris]VZO40614.1 hypothetical protein HALOF300_05322 [Occultella aeris]